MLTDQEKSKGYQEYTFNRPDGSVEVSVIDPGSNAVIRSATTPAAPTSTGTNNVGMTPGNTQLAPTPGANTAPVTPSPAPGVTTTPGLINNTQDPIAAYYEGLDRTEPDDADQAAIREKVRQELQGRIDATKAYYAGLLSQEQVRGQGRTGQGYALNARAGTTGSDFGNENNAAISDFNKQQEESIQREQAVKISEIENEIDSRASTEIAAKRAEALGNAEKYIQYKIKAQGDARDNVQQLAQMGVSLDKIDANRKAQLLKETGWDQLTFDQYFNYYTTQANKIDWKFNTVNKEDGGQMIVAYGIDPKTGQLVTKNYDPTPTGGQVPKIIDGKPYILKRKEDGTPYYEPVEGIEPDHSAQYKEWQDYAREETKAGRTPLSFNAYQTMDANRKRSTTHVTVNAGQVYNTEKGTFLTNAEAALNASKGSDQKANPNLYRDLRSEYQKRFGKSTEFEQQLPISRYLSPQEQQGDLTPPPAGSLLGG